MGIKRTVNTIIKDNKYKHNYKLTEDDQKEICLNYMFHKPIEATLNQFQISEQTYYAVVRKHKKNDYAILDEDIKKLRRNFSKKTSLLIDKLLAKLEDQIEGNDDINISQITTSLGILYDKQALAEGTSTSNQAVNINIKIDN